MTQLKKLLVAFTPMGAAAYFAGGGTFSSIGELVEWARQPTRRVPEPAATSNGAALWRTKKALLLMMAIGAAAYFGLSGTFASFSAETSNIGSGISSGTLTMSDQVNTGTACLSMSGATQDNINAGCGAALTVSNIAPGMFGPTQIAKITIQNTGSIDASKLYLYAPSVNARLSTPLPGGVAVTTLTVTPLEGPVAISDQIVVSFGGHSQTFTASAAAAGGATSISVSGSPLANFSYPLSSNVNDTSSNTTVNNTDCYDVKTPSPGTPGATQGSQLNFNPTTGNPFCSAVLMYVQETTGNTYYCWSGKGSSPQSANGLCVAPISVTLTTGLTSGVAPTTLQVSPLNGNVTSGNQITVTSGTSTQSFTASADAHIGDTSIAVSGAPNANFSYPSSSPVVNTSALTSLNSDTTDTISNFDTLHPVGGRIQLVPVLSNGNLDTNATVQLSHFNTGNYTRTFSIGLYLPVPAGSNQNALQGLASTFGLTWHIDQ
jgi:hypothetical protein